MVELGQFFSRGGPQISVTIEGKKMLLGRIDLFDFETRRLAHQVIEDTSLRTVVEAQIATKAVTGAARKSISILKLGDLAQVVRPTSKHYSYMEFGAGPLGASTQEIAPEHWKHKPIPRASPRKIQTWLNHIGKGGGA